MAGKLQALQLWCQKRVEGYRDVEVVNMTTSWRSGLAFCAILHRFRPDIIDYDSLSKENVLENNDLAFRVAEQELGIPALLEAPDMIAMKVPDRLSVITYVAQYHNYFRDKEMLGGPGVKGSSSPKKAVTPSSGVKRHQPREPTKAPDAKKFAPRQDNALNKVDANEMPRMNSMSDICEICKKKVYILERHIENAKLYHRSCFRRSDMSPASKIYARPSALRSGDPDKATDGNKTSQNIGSNLGFQRTRQDVMDTDINKSDFRNGHKSVLQNVTDKRGMESKDRFETSSPRTRLRNLIGETDSEISKLTNGYSSDRHKIVTDDNSRIKYSVENSIKSDNTSISDRLNKIGDRLNSPIARTRSSHSSDDLVNASKSESKGALSKLDVKSEPISLLSHGSKHKSDVEKMDTDSSSPVPRPRLFLKKDEAKTWDRKLHNDDVSEKGESAKPLPSPRENVRGRFKSSSSEDSDISAPPPLPVTMPPPASRSLVQEIKQNRKQITNDKSELKSPRRPNQVSKLTEDRLQAKKTQSKQLPVVAGQKSVISKRNTVQSAANSDISSDIGHESGDSDGDIDDIFAKAQVYQAGSEQTAVLVIPGKKTESQANEPEHVVLSGLLKSLAGVRKQQGDKAETKTDQKFISPPNHNSAQSEKTVYGSKNESRNPTNIKSADTNKDDYMLSSKLRSQTSNNKSTDKIFDSANIKNGLSTKETENVKSVIDTSKRTNLKTDPASRLRTPVYDKTLETDRTTNDSIPRQKVNVKSPFNLKPDLASNSGVQNIILRKKKDASNDSVRPKSASVLLDSGKYKLASTSKDDSEMRSEIRSQFKKEQKRDNVKCVDFSTNLRNNDNNRNFNMKKNAGDKDSEEKLPWQLEAEKRMAAASKGKFLDPGDPKAMEKRKQLKSSQENLTNMDTNQVSNIKDRSQFKLEQNAKPKKAEVDNDVRIRTDKTRDIVKTRDLKVETRKQLGDDKPVPRYPIEDRHNKIGDMRVNMRVPDRKVTDDNVNISPSKHSRSPPLRIDLTDNSSSDTAVAYNAKSDKTNILSGNSNDKEILSSNINGHLNPSDGEDVQPAILHVDLLDDNAAYDNITETVHLSPRNRNNNTLQDTWNEHNNSALPSSVPQRPMRKLVTGSQDVNETDLDNINFNYDVPPRRPTKLPIENNVSNLRKIQAPRDILSPQTQISSHKRPAPPPPCLSPRSRSPSPAQVRDWPLSSPLRDQNRVQSPDRAGKYYKRPAPDRPAPPRRSISHCRMSAIEIQRSLRDIDSKLTDLELKGRQLEDAIRNAGNNEEEEEDLMIDWFGLINNKNELIREEADMIYAARAHELEQEQTDVEYRLRCLMTKLDRKKTEVDYEEEAYLLQRLLDLVDQRSRIVDSIDEDKQRYEEEDKNIAIMMEKKGLVRNTEGEKTSAIKIKM